MCFIDFREERERANNDQLPPEHSQTEGQTRSRGICCNRESNLQFLGQCSNQLSHLARAQII